MSFELRVELSGLFLYLLDPSGKKVAALMPDARKFVKLRHEDRTKGKPHTGYLLFDLENLDGPGTAITGVESHVPQCQVVYRFDREQLDFDVPGAPQKMRQNLLFPDFERVAPNLEPIPGLFTDSPPKQLLMRTVFTGGDLTSFVEPAKWTFAGAERLGAESDPAPTPFASFATWNRRVTGKYLNIKIQRFGQGETGAVTIRLKPTPDADGTPRIKLALANLCSENPLEWEELPLAQTIGPDVDFKWIYRLLRPRQSADPDLMKKVLLPIPGAGVSAERLETAEGDCLSGQLFHPFP